MDRNEAIKIVKSHYPANKQMLNEALEFLIPELKESENEDERMKKSIIQTLKKYSKCVEDGNDSPSAKDFLVKDIENQIAWLEKQGEQKPTIEMKSAEESLGIDSETYNKIVDECIYSEQKSQRMVSAEAKEAMYDKPACAWSEEDESWFKELELMALSFSNDVSYLKKFFDWLKSLKQRIVGEQ